ncbi:TPA: hypothetical protein ACH3X2_008373 [Trebouxia sp. C0005]
MPAQNPTFAGQAGCAELSDALKSVSLQQPAQSIRLQPGGSKAETKDAVALTAFCSVPLPPAPTACLSPRIHSRAANPGSRAALNLQSSKSPLAQRSARNSAGVSVLRKSADAVLTTAKSAPSSSPKVAAFRQACQRSGVQESTSNVGQEFDDISAAVRRSRMRIDKIGINRDSAHERRRLEIYALNTILCASEDAKLQELIKQHANDAVKDADVTETEHMIALAAVPDSDDDKYQGNSPRATKSGYAGPPTGSFHKV